jgi:hypothetical protein
MLRTIDINITVVAGQGTYKFPSNSLGLLPTDVVKGISLRSSGVSKNNGTLVSATNLNKAFLTLTENGGTVIHANLSLGKILEMSNSDRFQMLPIQTRKGVFWEESVINMVGDSETNNQVIEITVFFMKGEDAANC